MSIIGRRYLHAQASKERDWSSGTMSLLAMAGADNTVIQDGKIGFEKAVIGKSPSDAAHYSFDFLFYTFVVGLAAFVVYQLWMLWRKEKIIAAEIAASEQAGFTVTEDTKQQIRDDINDLVNTQACILGAKIFSMVFAVGLAGLTFERGLEHHFTSIKEDDDPSLFSDDSSEVLNMDGAVLHAALVAIFAALAIYLVLRASSKKVDKYTDLTVLETEAAADRKALATTVGLYTFLLHITAHCVEHSDKITGDAQMAMIVPAFLVITAMLYILAPRVRAGFLESSQQVTCTESICAFGHGFVKGPETRTDEQRFRDDAQRLGRELHA